MSSSAVFGASIRRRQSFHFPGGSAGRLTRSFASNCSSNSASTTTSSAESRPRVPVLMRLSPWKHGTRRILLDVNGGKETGEIQLPAACRHLIGSSGGFLFSVDYRRADIHATNPFTGDRLPLPPTVSLPCMTGVRVIWDDYITDFVYALNQTINPTSDHLLLPRSLVREYYYSKAIASPQLDSVVVIEHHHRRRLAFAKTSIRTRQQARGGNRSRPPPPSAWTALESPVEKFQDMIFHKGRLHAINSYGVLAVFDLENPAALPTLYEPFPDHGCLRSMMSSPYVGAWSNSLVESPDGEDLFVLSRGWRRGDLRSRARITNAFMVFKLDNDVEGCNRPWRPVHDIGDVAMFVGQNQSQALSTRDFPQLKPNCIYFTEDILDDELVDMEKPQARCDAGVFDLERRSAEFYTPGKLPKTLTWPPAIWYMPTP